jgi:hypothetical protein
MATIRKKQIRFTSKDDIFLLGNDHFTWRGGGYGFFSRKNILIPNVAEKDILILVEEKNNNLIQSFCHIT